MARLDGSAPGKPKSEWGALCDRVSELDDQAFEIASRIVDRQANTTGGLAAKLHVIRLEAGFREDTRQPERPALPTEADISSETEHNPTGLPMRSAVGGNRMSRVRG